MYTCNRIWKNQPYGDYCRFELWAKIYTQLTYHVFSDYHSTKKILSFAFLLAPKWWLYEPALAQANVSFGPLVLPLIACNGETLTWLQCYMYYGSDSGSTSISVLQLACSHDQASLQVAVDTSILFQEDSRIAVNHQRTIQHTLWSLVGVSASRVTASVYIVYGNYCYTIIVQ